MKDCNNHLRSLYSLTAQLLAYIFREYFDKSSIGVLIRLSDREDYVAAVNSQIKRILKRSELMSNDIEHMCSNSDHANYLIGYCTDLREQLQDASLHWEDPNSTSRRNTFSKFLLKLRGIYYAMYERKLVSDKLVTSKFMADVSSINILLGWIGEHKIQIAVKSTGKANVPIEDYLVGTYSEDDGENTNQWVVSIFNDIMCFITLMEEDGISRALLKKLSAEERRKVKETLKVSLLKFQERIAKLGEVCLIDGTRENLLIRYLQVLTFKFSTYCIWDDIWSWSDFKSEVIDKFFFVMSDTPIERSDATYFRMVYQWQSMRVKKPVQPFIDVKGAFPFY